jgi:hypothetical protein
MPTGPSKRMQSDAERVYWLSCYPHLWKDWDGHFDSRAVDRMKAAGLVAMSTYWKDVRLTRLIAMTRIHLGEMPGTLPFKLSSSTEKG